LLVWSVTLDGAADPYTTGRFPLSNARDLPATLAISAGPTTTAPVTVRIEGYKDNGDGNAPRVTREARVVVPADRIARLDMPLSWLCTTANLESSCPERQTCVAGKCVASNREASSLPDYAPSTPAQCRPMSSCFENIVPVALSSDRSMGCTITGSSPLGSDGDVSIVLEVDNEKVGNYGYCGAFGKCFVPLHRNDSPEGWQVVPAETPTVRLPDGVCDAVGRGVFRVVVLPPTAACPPDRGNFSLCVPEETCLPAERICPEDWPSSWVGYVCSGKATPYATDREALLCLPPPVDAAEPDAPINGRACCARGEQPSNDPLLIDDMSGGSQIKIDPPEGMTAGFWWTSLGDGSGDLAPSPQRLYTYRTIDPPVTPEGGPEIRKAACLKSTGFRGWVAVQGFEFLTEDARSTPDITVDLSRYRGVSFWGWADEPYPDSPLSVQLEFPNKDTIWGRSDATCWTPEDQSGRCENFRAFRTLGREWKPYTVLWSELRQSNVDWPTPQYRPPGGFDPNVYYVSFLVEGAGPDTMSQPFDFCVADIRFVE
jgi:hypothetical protein